jgi:tetratricopeptide (TPR) repeat protein
MKEIFGHMSQLILALRYGNQSYYRGDFNRAMDNYMGVYEMMEAVDNKRGLGVCLNNIANLYLNQKDFQKAENYYGKAIQNVSNLIEQESDTGKQNKLKLIRANRKMNLGSMFTSKGDFKEAFRHLQEAYNEHVAQGNMSGIAQVAGNIVQAHIEMKEYQNADQLAEQVLQIVNRTIPDPQNITKEAAAAYQYVCLNMGLCRQARGDLAEAAKWFRYALDRLPTVVAQVSNPCLMGLAAYYAQTDPPKAKEIERLTLANVAPKDVYLVLDVSGSMLHNIQTCRTSMKKILAILNDNDSLQLTTFASELVEAFPLTPIRGNRETLASYIDTKTTLRGRTAFYDALLATGGKIENKRASNSWVVALTDGEDNESHFRSENNVRRLFGRLHQSLGDGFKLILITVGTLQNMYTIQSIQASAGPSSILIKADNVNEIQRAFESVAEMLTANLSVETL